MLDLAAVDAVLLDMDGTLLDLHFDNHFWREHVPRRYAEKHALAEAIARRMLAARYAACAGTLAWYSTDHWQAELGLDIMALKRELRHLIALRPHVRDFLGALRTAGRRTVLVTNAHRRSLELKMSVTGLEPSFDALVSSHDLGMAKERPEFWRALRSHIGFDPQRTALIDDSVPVLDSARAFGIAHLLSIARPDSRLPAQCTGAYRAIETFRELTSALDRSAQLIRP